MEITCRFAKSLFSHSSIRKLSGRHVISSSGQNKSRYGTLGETFAVTYKEHGDPRKVLQGDFLPISHKLGADDVLVKMLAAPINPADINMIEGTYPLKPVLPTIVGNEGVGEVLEVGTNVKTIKVGEWVLPDRAGWGTWREYAVGPESDFYPIPSDIPVNSAATITVNPCTAYRMLTDFVGIRQGDTVIQNGANSVAGQAVIQIAASRKVNTINVVRNRPDIEELKDTLKNLGATHVVTEEFCRSLAMKELMKSVSRPKLALNCVGGKSSTELIRLLDKGGVMVTYGGMSKQPVTVPTGVMIFKEIKLAGYWMTEWSERNRTSSKRREMFEDLCQLIRDCRLIPPPCNETPLREFQAAISQAMEGYTGKKQLLQIHKVGN